VLGFSCEVIEVSFIHDAPRHDGLNFVPSAKVRALNPQITGSWILYPIPQTTQLPAPCSLYPTPVFFTLLPAPYTLLPTSYTLHPTPYTLHLSSSGSVPPTMRHGII